MPLIGSFTKQPAERLPVDIDFTAVVASRTVDSISASVTVPSGMTMANQSITGNKLQIYVLGGATLNSYRWEIDTTITIGGIATIVEDEFDVVVLKV